MRNIARITSELLPAIAASKPSPNEQPISSHANSTVRRGRSARSSMSCRFRHWLRCPNAFSVARKSPLSISSRSRPVRRFEARLVESMCGARRRFSQEPFIVDAKRIPAPSTSRPASNVKRRSPSFP